MDKTSNPLPKAIKPRLIAVLHRHFANISDDQCRRRLNGLRLLSAVYGWPDMDGTEDTTGTCQDLMGENQPNM